VKLRDQIEYLQRSCRDYDAGHWNEAQRMATPIRLLFHDTGRSRSLLKQMELKARLRMENAAMTVAQFEADEAPRPKPGEPGVFTTTKHLTQRPGLALPAVDAQRLVWAPRFAAHPPTEPVGFDYWWNDAVIAGDSGRTYSRADIVKAMANQDGGTHIEDLAETYAQLLEDSHGQLAAMGARDPADPSGEGFAPPRNTIAHASVRQIAYEVLVTFDRDLRAYTI